MGAGAGFFLEALTPTTATSCITCRRGSLVPRFVGSRAARRALRNVFN